MVVRMRVNRSKSGKRRSHHALFGVSTRVCVCGANIRPHRACASCGNYNGIAVIDTTNRASRALRRNKRHEKALKAAGVTNAK